MVAAGSGTSASHPPPPPSSSPPPQSRSPSFPDDDAEEQAIPGGGREGGDDDPSSPHPISPIVPATRFALGYVLPPDGLVLLQAHYLVRHGERTPVRTRLARANPPIPEVWNMCHTGRRFQAAVLDVVSSPSPASVSAPSSGTDGEEDGLQRLESRAESSSIVVKRRPEEQVRHGKMEVVRVAEGSEEKTGRPIPGRIGDCLLGELTDLGRRTTLQMGREIRKLYVDQLGFLPSQLSNTESVYFRSTSMARTIETLQQIVRGVYPDGTLADGMVLPLLVRNPTAENLLPNTIACARLRRLWSQFADLTAREVNPHLARFDDKLSKHIDGKPVRIDGSPRISGIFDTIRAADAHGLPVPAEFKDPEVSRTIEKAICEEWFAGYRAPDLDVRTQFRRLAMYRLLRDLTVRLQDKAELGERSPLKLAVYSTHDTTVAGVLAALDSFDDRWPRFTANLSFELFRDSNSSSSSSPALSIGQRASQLFAAPIDYLKSFFSGGSGASLASHDGFKETPDHYLRIRYDSRPVSLPACAPAGKHYPGRPELCKFDVFKEAVQAMRNREDKSWEEECEET